METWCAEPLECVGNDAKTWSDENHADVTAVGADSKSRRDLNLITWLRLRFANGSAGEFDNRMRRKACGETPCTDVAANLFDAVLTIKVDEIDGKLHKEGVNGFAGNDPHAFSAPQAFFSEKAFGALRTRTRNLRVFGNHRVAGKVANFHAIQMR